ncbi:EAL domain-containing protein [Salmonella enterica]
MIVTLENTWRSELLLLPARDHAGSLQGLEVIVNFVGDDSNVRVPTDLIIPRLSINELLLLFAEQLALLEACQFFFLQHQLIAWINISPLIVNALLENNELAENVKKYPFLELMINENFPALNKGRDNQTLELLTRQYAVVLANFGAGAASSKAIFDGLFKRVALDKNFVQQRLLSRSFEPFMRAIVSQLEPHCEGVMIAGVDDETILKRVLPFHFSAMQGALWPAVSAQQITTLVQI